MISKIIYDGPLDPVAISKIKIPVRRALRAAIFDNFKNELSVEEMLSLLPTNSSLDSLISICDKLGFISCKVVYFPETYPCNNISVFFKRLQMASTKVKI